MSKLRQMPKKTCVVAQISIDLLIIAVNINQPTIKNSQIDIAILAD